MVENQTNIIPLIKKRYFCFCGLLLFVGVCISIIEIIMRLFFHLSYDFMTDLSVWFPAWATLLSAGPLLIENDHISIDFFRQRMWGATRLTVELFNGLCAVAFGVGFTWGGIVMIQAYYVRHSVYPRYFPIPTWLVQLCVPIGMGVFSLCALIILGKAMKR